MTVLVVNNQKGGVGKTMLAVHIAWFLAEQPGARVALFDFDSQGNASVVLADAQQGGDCGQMFRAGFVPPSTPAPVGLTLFKANNDAIKNLSTLSEAVGNVSDEMLKTLIGPVRELTARFDYVVIDTPPSWGVANKLALAVADHVLSPLDVELFSLQGIAGLRRNIATVIKELRGGKAINYLGILPSRVQTNSPAQKENLKNLVKASGPLLFRGLITQRQGYSQAMADKTPIWRMKTTAQREAAKEMNVVLQTLKSKLEAHQLEVVA